MSTVLNGIEPPLLPARSEARVNLGLHEKDLVIGFVGRLERQKAPERLIRTLHVIGNQQSKLVMVGTGSLEKTLRSLVDKLGLHARVLFVGEQNGQMIMPAFDLLVVPSRDESMGYVFLEANAADLPIMTTPVGIARDVVQEGKTGCFVPNTDDVEPWARTLNEMLNKNTLETFRKNAANRRKTFSANQMVAETIKIYNDVAW
jgi:glycosyltransferase involved in cell wall biosynthesis